MANQGVPPNDPRIPQQQVVIVKGSSASGIFWGLFLFFIILPLGTCLTCTVCGGAALVGRVPPGLGETSTAPSASSEGYGPGTRTENESCEKNDDCQGGTICSESHCTKLEK
jgi:hypothetical protein